VNGGAPRYRWGVLAAGTAAQATYLALLTGPAVLAPVFRDELGLTLTQVGVVIAAPWVGPILTLLPWGLLADRIGERRVLAGGLGICGLLSLAIAFVDAFVPLVVLLAAIGAAGASVNSASGRAVMSWFGTEERGLALGIRQGSTPLGGVVSALALPAIADAGGLHAAFLFLGALVLIAATVGGLVLRDAPTESGVEAAPRVLRDRRLWRLAGAGGLYLVAQLAVTGFVVLYLHDERELSNQQAGAVLAVMQALAIVVRIVLGRWSDVLGDRIQPLRLMGTASAIALAITALLLGASTQVVIVAFVVAGTLGMSWNGLAFAGAAELAGRARSGAALGFQQTVLSATAAVATPVFAAAVDATSWRAAFLAASVAPIVGWAMLGSLQERV
jgi:sugar phosphate permease